jgi:hypothetical protein
VTTKTLSERLWSKVLVTENPMECWPFTGKIMSKAGYGVIVNHGGTTRAHRVAYELSRGPIPAGLVLDHLCRNRACCNPSHLEPVTNAENVRRGVSVEATRAFFAAMTHCKRGHAFDAENTMHGKGRKRRICRECTRQATRDFRARNLTKETRCGNQIA